MACGILVPQPEIKPAPSAVKAQSFLVKALDNQGIPEAAAFWEEEIHFPFL